MICLFSKVNMIVFHMREPFHINFGLYFPFVNVSFIRTFNNEYTVRFSFLFFQNRYAMTLTLKYIEDWISIQEVLAIVNNLEIWV